MDRHEGSRIRNRGTVLVVSRSDLFSDIISEMVVDSGFASASPVASEPAWLTLTRTEPCIVICDCDAPADNTQSLIAEASARNIPLMLSDRRFEHHIQRTLTLARRLVWLTLPVTQAAFGALLDGLLPSTAYSQHRVAVSGPGMSMEAAFSVRALIGTSRARRGNAGRILAHIGHTDDIDNGRADDDGMPVAAD